MDALGLLQQLGAVPSPPVSHDRSPACAAPSQERSRSAMDADNPRALHDVEVATTIGAWKLARSRCFVTPSTTSR
jgi:hypothetical protein